MKHDIIDANHSILLIVDLQDRLLPAIEHGDTVVEHAAWLVGIARELGVPILITEHYPQGVGATSEKIGRLINPDERIEKIHFSAVAEGNLGDLGDWAATKELRFNALSTVNRAPTLVVPTCEEVFHLAALAERRHSRCSTP